MTRIRITKDTPIEELVEKQPGAVTYLTRKGLACIVCGEPVWGTIESLAGSKGFSDEQIDDIVHELRHMPL